MSHLDHTNALWAEGRGLMEWLDGIAVVCPPSPAARRRIERWRHGAQASFWHIDELLTGLYDQGVRLHVQDVPSELWQPYDNGRRRCIADTEEVAA